VYPYGDQTIKENTMTYPPNCTLPAELIEQLASDGFDALPDLIRVLLNTAMQVEH